MASHCIDNQWIEGGGQELVSHDPATGEAVWRGSAATPAQVDRAIAAARRAFEGWADLPLEQRIDLLERFAERVRAGKARLAQMICRETGKPRWEAQQEVELMISKAPVSIDAYQHRRAPSQSQVRGDLAVTQFRPHGVLAVFGPFNMPGHLPNGHIMPALLAGNTLVLKPSELTPGVGQQMMELWIEAGLPPGVLNLVQGGRDTGQAIVQHPGIDGVLFTGSYAGGRALSRTLADRPEKMLALEMGGNNPLVVHRASDLEAAAYLTILSAYLTAGQRCTCARRLIVIDDGPSRDFLDQLISMMRTIRVGRCTDEPEPFMGPLISPAAAQHVLEAQESLIQRGAKPLVKLELLPGSQTMLRPGLLDVTAAADRADEEIFGPLLQVVRVPDFDAAIEEANRTAYGLAAGLLSDEAALFDRFFRRVRAGVVNWNRQTTGASSRLPFGGIGQSGNHRPGGYYAVDYCADPVASLQRARLSLPESILPGVLR